jgi:hypothetical protein
LTAVSGTEKRLAQNLFNILDFAPKAANRTLAIVEGNIGEHSGSKFENAAMATEYYVENLFRFTLNDGVHRTELVRQPGVVNYRKRLGDNFLDTISGAHGNYRKTSEHEFLLPPTANVGGTSHRGAGCSTAKAVGLLSTKIELGCWLPIKAIRLCEEMMQHLARLNLSKANRRRMY